MARVTEEITAEVDQLRVLDTAPGLAALAISLAESVDAATAPAAKVLAGRELRAVMSELRKLAPVGEKGDSVDDIAAQRAKRRAAARERAAEQG